MVKPLFTDEDHRRIETAVQEAEKRTSGEIVIILTDSSAYYGWVRWIWATGGIALATAALWVSSQEWQWAPSLLQLVEWQALGGLALGSLAFLPAVVRLSTPKEWMAERVHREALANFCATGLHETRDRTGILIYLSELEHRVEILADRGIHTIVGPEYWEAQVSHIIKGIRGKHAADGIVEAVKEIGDKLATHFPPRADDANELSNRVRLGPQSPNDDRPTK